MAFDQITANVIGEIRQMAAQLELADICREQPHDALTQIAAVLGFTERTPNGPEFTDTGRAALLWVLWHHQGGSSPTGQAIRFALGMGQFDRLTADQVAQAKAWAPGIPGLAHTDPAGVTEVPRG